MGKGVQSRPGCNLMNLHLAPDRVTTSEHSLPLDPPLPIEEFHDAWSLLTIAANPDDSVDPALRRRAAETVSEA